MDASAPVGVPLITQVVELIERPTESAGEIVQLVIAAPFSLSVVGETDNATPTEPAVPLAPL